MYNDIMNEVLSLNNQQRKKDVIDTAYKVKRKLIVTAGVVKGFGKTSGKRRF